MNKKLLAALALTAVAGAAQADVTLYGVIDLAVGNIQHSLSGSPTFPATVDPVDPLKNTVVGGVNGMFNGGLSPSRWGIKGTEDIGGGVKAVFTLESGIDANTGNVASAAAAIAANAPNPNQAAAPSSINGQLFNRQAWAGLSDAKLGQLIFGRIYAPEFDIVVAYDPVQAAQLFSPLGFSGSLGGGGGYTEDLRNDNTVRYSNQIGAVNVGGMYKFGNVSGNNSARQGWALNAGYEAGKFGVQAAYLSFNDVLHPGNTVTSTPSTLAAGTIAVTEANTRNYMLAAKYKVTDAGTVKAGYEHITYSTASDMYTTATVGTYYGFPIASVADIGASRNQDLYWVGGDYNVTPSINLAVAYYDLNVSQSADNKQLNGDQRYYSFLADYSFSKRTDVYFGVMQANFSGPQYAAYMGSNNITAIGMRHRF